MKQIIGIALILFSSCSFADYINGDMTLRDAMYLYNQDITGDADFNLVGYNCDIFELVLQVNQGYVDVMMAEANNQGELAQSGVEYPDRIYSTDAMFAYTLYKNKAIKVFAFWDKNNDDHFSIAKATVFGYCFSTKADAKVSLHMSNTCTVLYSDGTTGPETDPECVPH